jgi:outer membrane murein-binding lipoprotein Lpp
MSAVCLWCESEARGEVREGPGLCLVHRFEALITAADAPASRAFLIVVARNEAALFHRLSEWFLEDPRVRVIMDRRRGDRRQRAEPPDAERRQRERRETPPASDDIRLHPAVILSVLPAVVRAFGAGDDERGRPEPMDPAELRERLSRWLRESREMVNDVLPVLYRRTEIARDRADTVEREGRRLAAQVTELETEVTRLRAEIHQLKRERDTFVENIERAVNDVARMTSRFTARTRSD